MKGAVDRKFQRFYSESQLLTGIKKNGYHIVEEARGVIGIKLSAKKRMSTSRNALVSECHARIQDRSTEAPNVR